MKLTTKIVKDLNYLAPKDLDCIIVLGKDSDKQQRLNKAKALVVNIPIKDYNIDDEIELKDCAADIDIKMILDLVELCHDAETVYIHDLEGQHKAWAVALGVEVYKNKKQPLKDILRAHAIRYPDIKPSAIWVIELLDYCLDCNGELIELIEEYLVTGVLVSSTGIFEAIWD
jgi:predicted protein tyrosine phosphatase